MTVRGAAGRSGVNRAATPKKPLIIRSIRRSGSSQAAKVIALAPEPMA